MNMWTQSIRIVNSFIDILEDCRKSWRKWSTKLAYLRLFEEFGRGGAGAAEVAFAV